MVIPSQQEGGNHKVVFLLKNRGAFSVYLWDDPQPPDPVYYWQLDVTRDGFKLWIPKKVNLGRKSYFETTKSIGGLFRISEGLLEPVTKLLGAS